MNAVIDANVLVRVLVQAPTLRLGSIAAVLRSPQS